MSQQLLLSLANVNHEFFLIVDRLGDNLIEHGQQFVEIARQSIYSYRGRYRVVALFDHNATIIHKLSYLLCIVLTGALC